MRRKMILLLLVATPAAFVTAQDPSTLRECLEIGLANNYSVRIVRNEEQVTDNNATRANAGALPVVGLSGSLSGQSDLTWTTPRQGERSRQDGTWDPTANIGLNASWTIFDGFSIRTSYEKLQELKARGSLQTRIAMEDFVAELTAEYYNYIQQQIRRTNLHNAVTLSRERLRIVEARYVIGSFSRLDLLQARVDFNADSSAYMNQTELVLTSRIRLNELMARQEVTARLPIRDSLIGIDKNLEWERLKEETLLSNAELLVSAHDESLAGLDLRTVLARNYPSLRMNAGYGYTWNGYGSGATRYRGQLGPSAGLTLGFTIFDGNRRREQQNARVQIDNARLRRNELEQGLTADLTGFWQAYLNGVQVIRLEEENLTAARENLEIARERYLLGDLSGIEMREAQQSLLQAQERILTARYHTKLSEISLLLISGNVLEYMQ